MEPPIPPRIIRFGIFEVDLCSGELFKSGHKVRLETQPFQVLSMLLDKPGQLVTRDELKQGLWGQHTFVDFDHGLNAAIKRLREALNDEAKAPRCIETLPRRGYRFIYPIDQNPELASAHRTNEPNVQEATWLIWIGVILAFLLFTLLLVEIFR